MEKAGSADDRRSASSFRGRHPSSPPTTPSSPHGVVVVVVVVGEFIVEKQCSTLCYWSALPHQHQQQQQQPQQHSHHHPTTPACVREKCDHCRDCDDCWDAATSPLVPVDYCTPNDYEHSVLEHSTPYGVAAHLAARLGHARADRLVELHHFETVRTVLAHLEVLNGVDLDDGSVKSPAGLLTWYVQEAGKAQINAWTADVRQREIELAVAGNGIVRWPGRRHSGQLYPPNAGQDPPAELTDYPGPRPRRNGDRRSSY